MPRKKKAEASATKMETTEIQLQVKIPLVILKNWEVSLPHAPRLVVQAATGEAAWELYKQRFGIISSEWTAEIRETDEPAMLVQLLEEAR